MLRLKRGGESSTFHHRSLVVRRRTFNPRRATVNAGSIPADGTSCAIGLDGWALGFQPR